MNDNKKLVEELAGKIKTGEVQPWKTESVLLEEYRVNTPDHFQIAALSRRKCIEELTGQKFNYLELPDKPYLMQWCCPNDNSIWQLEARDADTTCTQCGSDLAPYGAESERYLPLVNNYIGGREEYYSSAGQIKVRGDIDKIFTNILAYGPGFGSIGISVGCFRINKLGGAEVKIGKWAGAARNLGYIFASEEERDKAVSVVKTSLPSLRKEMEEKYLSEFRGEIYEVEFVRRQHHGQYFIYICFYTRFENARGHGDTSRAVGFARGRLDDEFNSQGIAYIQSLIAMGFDGDLKPSSRNRRGRYVSAQVKVSIPAYEKMSKAGIDKLMSYMEIDRQGVMQEQGYFLYSGMGGEIIPALYRGTKVNPRPYNVSCTENVYVEINGDELIFGVELPNLEVGATSNREGPICPTAREVLKVMGIGTSKEFAAAAAAITLAGEFNFTLLHLRGEMYAGK
ncbi:hydroxymethylglutaryl-CoA reductase [Candidatus Scalindua japonica]|uniref:Hydroxymethylglutaryl-CoA reductase n=1 Tax=Candidatus Scalindua japonica TaxID=1284222 RepID=A0A286TU60_9BACT|nr:hypothetical protein [Candidatus Scalindua japonica]GAX59429.1 hydroxymethylglutaryl-CoA reductase [Candidatus Scalindua japonica]